MFGFITGFIEQGALQYKSMNDEQNTILTAQWAKLTRGSVDPKHDWHWPVMSTIGQLAHDPSPWPQVRTVVLRKVNVKAHTLEVHTDSRAGKLHDLQQSPNTMMHFYDQRTRTQLRLACKAQINLNNTITEQAWALLAPTSKAQYIEFDATHFAVIYLQVIEIDWLWLAREGHQRLKFSLQADQSWSAQALKP